MIGKVTRGRDPIGLARYLHGPGKANEHTYLKGGKAYSGGRLIGGSVQVESDLSGEWGSHLAAAIAQRENVRKGVWHCSIRAAEDDRTLSDGEWRVIAERLMERFGVDESHPWAVVRHADDHVHIALSRVSFDGTEVAKMSHDYRVVEAVLRAVERDHGLTQVPNPDRDSGRPSPHERVTGGEAARAIRTRTVPDRTELAVLVRAARDASAGGGREQFEAELTRLGVQFRANEARTGRMNGYSFDTGSTDSDGQPVWLAASKVARDLSWNQLAGVLDSGQAVDKATAAKTATRSLDDAEAAWAAAAERRDGMSIFESKEQEEARKRAAGERRRKVGRAVGAAAEAAAGGLAATADRTDQATQDPARQTTPAWRPSAAEQRSDAAQRLNAVILTDPDSAHLRRGVQQQARRGDRTARQALAMWRDGQQQEQSSDQTAGRDWIARARQARGLPEQGHDGGLSL